MINDYLDMGILFLKRGTISYHKREINFLSRTKQPIQAVISKVSINEAEQKMKVCCYLIKNFPAT